MFVGMYVSTTLTKTRMIHNYVKCLRNGVKVAIEVDEED